MTLSMAPEFPDGLAWFNTDRPLQLHEELRGRVVVLDFWTYCCINCMHVLPDLAYLEEKYADDPVVFIGVHSNKYPNEAHPANVREAILRYGITHPVVVDEEHMIWEMYAVHAWPTLMVIDSEGRLIGALPGEGHRDELDRAIAALLDIGHEQETLTTSPLTLTHEQRPPSSSGLCFPGKVLAQGNDRLFISDSGHQRVLITDWAGNVEGFFGSGLRGNMDGAYSDARFAHPQGLALFDNLLYIADTENHMLRRADLTSYHVDTVLGNGMIGYDRHGGHHGREQLLNSPWDVAFLNGQLYIAMAGLHQLWAYNPTDNSARVIAGTGRENITDAEARKSALAQPSGLATDGHVLYFADSETSAIRRYDPRSGQITTLVGKGLFEFGNVDGPEAEALLQHPLGVTVHGDHLYVADTYNHKIRKISLKTGDVSTVVGAGVPGRADGQHLLLYEPGGLSVVGHDLFIADTNNDRIIHYRLDTGQWNEVTPNVNGRPLGVAA